MTNDNKRVRNWKKSYTGEKRHRWSSLKGFPLLFLGVIFLTIGLTCYFKKRGKTDHVFATAFEDVFNQSTETWITGIHSSSEMESSGNPWSPNKLKEQYPHLRLPIDGLFERPLWTRQGVVIYVHRSVIGCGGRYMPCAKQDDVLHIRYIGRLDNGTIFDSTKGRQQFMRIELGSKNVSKSWNIGIEGMCAGEIRELLVPSYQFSFMEKNFHGNHWKKRHIHYLIQLVCIGETNPAACRWSASHQLGRERKDWIREQTVVVVAKRRQNCHRACRLHQLVCFPRGFSVINNCPTLLEYLDCKDCEIASLEGAGSDMPCKVSNKVPSGFSSGVCMISPNITLSTCEAFHLHTERLCPCVVATRMLQERTEYINSIE